MFYITYTDDQRIKYMYIETYCYMIVPDSQSETANLHRN